MSFNLITEGKELLRNIAFFEPFTDDEIGALLTFAHIKKFHLQDIVIAEKSRETFFYVVIKGAAKVMRGVTPEEIKNEHGSTNTLAIITDGACFGEMSILLGEKRTASVVAGVGCILFELDGKAIENLSDSIQKKIYKQFAINMAKRLVISSL